MPDEPKKVECLACNGEGIYDSGGVTPWGEWINVPCERCKGKGLVQVSDLTEEEAKFLRKCGVID